MKLAKFVLTPPLVAISVALCAALSSFGATCTFNGAWDTPPAAGDNIVVTGGELTWTAAMPHQVASWTQFGGTVTFETTYNDTFPKLEVTGNVVLEGGTWTQKKNTNDTRTYWLNVSVSGALTVGEDAVIHADLCGYQKVWLPDGGTQIKPASGQYRYGGSYGAYGSWQDDAASPDKTLTRPYGSIVAPVDPGNAGSGGAGGGAIRLDVAGALTLEGKIHTNGSSGHYGGSGGSIYVRAASVSGAGTMTANAATGYTQAYAAGAGGRIAVILTVGGADFTDWDPSVKCSCICEVTGKSEHRGGPGTIYAETAADVPGKGWLILKDYGGAHTRELCGAIPFNEDGTFGGFARLSLLNVAKAIVREGDSLDLSETVVESDATSFLQVLGGAFVAPPTGVSFNVTFSGSPATIEGDLTVTEGAVVTDDAGLTVTGDFILNGKVTRSGPFAQDPQPLLLTVGGDLTIGTSGSIDATGRGFDATRCPDGQTHVNFGGTAHGGRGWKGTSAGTKSSVIPYGSIIEPVTAGAGGNQTSGGAAVLLTVGGLLTNNGAILSEGNPRSSADYYRGAGGSLNIRAGSIAGSGRISADVGYPPDNHGPSGGGRVAIRLTDANADFDDYTGPITARGARKSDTANVWVGGAGTVWTSTAAQGDDHGTLVVDNGFPKLKDWAETPIGGLVTGNAFGDVFVGGSARLEVSEGASLFVSGVLSNGCEFAALADSTVSFFGTGLSRVYGASYSFANLAAEAPGKEIVFDDGAVIEVTGDGALSGAVDNNLTLRSATEGEAWTLKGANIALTGVALRDCQSESPITVMNGQDLGGNSANITFVNVEPGQLITWTGAADAAWGNAANWDRARTPIATDKVAVPAGAANQPVLATDTAVAEISVAAGASLSLGGKALTVTGNASFAGALICSGTDVLDVKGDLALASVVPAQSTVRLSGEEQTLTLDGTTLYALEVFSPALAVSGDLTCVTFVAGDGASALDLSFAAGMSLTATTMTVAGDPDAATGFLRCATDGGKWNLMCNDAHVSDVTVSGSDASKGVTVVPTDCVDGGDNVNWLFVDNRTHWTGAASSDFADPANWSDGVPTAEKDAVVEGEVECIIASAAAAGNFTVNPGAKVTVTEPFAVSGSFTALDGAVVTWNVPGTISGNLVLLSGATLTHAGNTTTEANKLNLAVGGTGYIAAGAKLTADGMGYNGNRVGPGAPSEKAFQCGASYGGRGYHYSGPAQSGPCYGSILCPTNCGSSGYFSGTAWPGGGAIKLTFGGALVLDGELSANGKTGDYYTGSGGSIWLTAASVSGAGTISAQGGDGTQQSFGGGGRVAIYLTQATSMDGFKKPVTVRGGIHTTGQYLGLADAAPGTYYLETAADEPGAGTLLLAGYKDHQTIQEANYRTELTPVEPTVSNETKKVVVVVKDEAYASITRDAWVEDITIPDATSRLYLNGYTLHVHTRRHALGKNEAVQVIPGERTDPETGETITGKIEWLTYGLMILVK